MDISGEYNTEKKCSVLPYTGFIAVLVYGTRVLIEGTFQRFRRS